MVILSGSNIGSTQPHSLPSPARGSPPGLSPSKGSTAVLPELTGLERMLNGWRRQAEKKAQQFRQREMESETKRQKEQQEVNEIRLKIIESRMKKIEQQQHSSAKNAKHNSSMSDSGLDSTRKRRADDEYYLGTPSDGGLSCDSPDAFGTESGYCAPKNIKLSAPDKPSLVEKNASVFIETFQLPPAPPLLQMAPRRPNIPQLPPYPAVDSKIHPSSAPGFGPVSMPASSMPVPYAQRQRSVDEQQVQAPISSFRGQVADVALPRDVEEEMIRSMPVDLDAAFLTPDFMNAIDSLDRPSATAARAPTSQAKPAPSMPSSTALTATMQRPTAHSNMQPPPYAMQQQYASMTHQQHVDRSHQQYYSMVNRTSALGAWHQQPAFAAGPQQYSNPYAMNGQMMQAQQQAPRGWPHQNAIGDPSLGFGNPF